MDNISPINIAVRVRPILKPGIKNTITTIFEDGEPPILVVSDKRNAFAFDHVFSEDVEQLKIYNVMLKPMIAKVLIGYNCTILAYGQTGTGKTYTMGTDSEKYNDSDPGLIPRVLDEFFDISLTNQNISISISFVEIYNEKVYNLLSSTKTELTVQGFEVKNMIRIPLKTNEDACHWLKIGGKNRHVRHTKMNASSSRSHAIFTVYCTKKDSGIISKLHLIDLAGSESVRRTGNQGTPLKEGVTINKGLLTLRRVINALSERNALRIPYRESMLTKYLHDSLNIDNFISLLVCVSPSHNDVSETINTLRFANEAKLLKSKPKLESILAEYDRVNPGILSTTEPLGTVRKKRLFPEIFTSTEVKKPNFALHNYRNRQMIDSPTYTSTMDSLSVSTSTTMDTSQQQFNYSPIVRRVKEVVDNSMLQMNNLINEQLMSNKILTNTNDQNKENACPFVVQCQLDENQMKEIISHITMNNKQLNKCTTISSPVIKRHLSFNSPTCNSESFCFNEQNKDETFKIPLVPKKIKLYEKKNIAINTSPVPVPKPRRSARISMQCFNVNTSTYYKDNHSNFHSPIARQCSVRLSVQNSVNSPPIPAPRSVMKPKQKKIVESKDNLNTLSTRRSTRLSMKLSNNQYNTFDENFKPLPIPRKASMVNTKLKISKEKTPKKSLIPKTIKKLSPHQIHRNKVLHILNYGSQKDIQLLQTVGTKSAVQILTYRELNGEFKNIEDLKKIPLWKDKRYDRFILSNQLD